MKLVIIAAVALVAVVVAAPQNREAEPIKIVRSDFDQQPNGAYETSFETENGIKQQETGELKSVPDEDNKPRDVIVVRGSYTYIDGENQPHKVEYYADETGFHAVSDDIPKQARR